jgi:hypothetical protein
VAACTTQKSITPAQKQFKTKEEEMNRVTKTSVLLTMLAVGCLLALPVSHNGSSAFAQELTQGRVDQLIDRFGSEDIADREAAAAELEKLALESLDNRRLIEDRLRAKGLTSTDAEIRGRSGDLW